MFKGAVASCGVLVFRTVAILGHHPGSGPARDSPSLSSHHFTLHSFPVTSILSSVQ